MEVARKTPSRAFSSALVTCLVTTMLLRSTDLKSSGGGCNFQLVQSSCRQNLQLLDGVGHYVSYDCGKSCASSSLLILQTSDGQPTSIYCRILDALQDAHLAYAAHWGFHYLRWDGLAKGAQAWLATYNRIYLLRALYKEGRHTWVLFVDPDAVIHDPRLNVADLLDERYAIVACKGGGGEGPEDFWDINIGVAFFNLRHPDISDVIEGWIAAIENVTDSALEEGGGTEAYMVNGQGSPVPDDQEMLHDVIRLHPRNDTLVKRFASGEDSNLFNYNEGKYVAHLIRAVNRDQQSRFWSLMQLRTEFFRILAEIKEEQADRPEEV